MKRFLAFIIAFMIAVSVINVPVYADSDRLENYPHSRIKFSEFEYEHIDIEALENNINEIRSLCSLAANKDKVQKIAAKVETELDKLTDMESYAAYMYNKTSQDPYWKEEDDYCADNIQRLGTLYIEVLQEAFVSPCKDAFSEWYDEAMMNSILVSHVPSEEELAYTQKQRKIVKEFYDINPTIEYLGKEYTVYTLLDAYYGGEISDFSIMYLYPKILNEIKGEAKDVYFRLVQNNNEYARLQGYDNYIDYAYDVIYMRKYTPEDGLVFCEEIRKKLSPYLSLFNAYDADYLISESGEALKAGSMEVLGEYLSRMAPEFREAYDYMRETESCDIIPAGNTPISFTSALPSLGMPFICMNESMNKLTELETLTHEFGHYDAFYWRNISVNMMNTLDLEETYSQGMEFLFSHYYPEILGEASKTAEMKHLGKTLEEMLECVMVAEIEITAYKGDYKSADELIEVLDKIQYKYFPMGFTTWFAVPHIYEYPGYYISYATSAANALEIYEKSNEDFDKALEIYIELIKNGSGPYDKAFSSAGLTVKWEKEDLDSFLDRIIDLYDDSDAPVIEGVEEGKTYDNAQMITLKDVSKITMLLSNGSNSEYLDFRKFIVAGSDSPYTLKVTDAFGNSSTVNFSVEPYPFIVSATSAGDKNTIKWDAVQGAKQYKVYGAAIGNKYKELGTVDALTLSFDHKVKGNKTYKYYVVAFGTDPNGKETILDKSLKCYVAGAKNTEKTDTCSVNIEGDETVSLKKGKVIRLSVSRELNEADEADIATGKIKAIRYISTNTSVAKVSKNGKVTGVKKGTCYIYAVSENGHFDKIKIKVG